MELPFPLTFRFPGIQGLGGLRGWKQGQPLGSLDLERGELECGVTCGQGGQSVFWFPVAHLGRAQPLCPSQTSEYLGSLALLWPHKAQSGDSERVRHGFRQEGAVTRRPRLQKPRQFLLRF